MKPTALTGLLSLLLITSGCSTIITNGRKDVHLRSNPSGAHVAISDEKGVPVFEGQTPTVVTLKTGKAYFAPKRYSVQVSKEGYQPATFPLHGTVSGWYAGNLIFGGLLGLLIVDPLTGAMYTLPKEKAFELVPSSSSGATSLLGPSLQVTEYSNVPADLRSSLVRLN